MKKLMVAFAAVAMAAVVNAAQCTWSATMVSAGNGVVFNSKDDTTKGDGFAVWCFITASTQPGVDTVVSSYDTVKTAILAGSAADWADSTTAKSTTSKGSASGIKTGAYGVDQADTISGFMVIFDNADYTKAGYAIVTEVKTMAEIAKGATTGKTLMFTKATETYGWSAIASGTPEPTSGLLLLLGVAGLALRRRRA